MTEQEQAQADQDELDLLRLRKQKALAMAQQQAAPTAPPEAPGRAKATLGGIIQGITAGHFDDLAGFAGPALLKGGVELGPGAQPSPDDTPEVRAAKEALLRRHAATPTDREIMKATVQQGLDEAQQAHPNYFGAGRAGGALLMAPVVGALTPAALTGVGGAATVGGALGLLNGAGESRANLMRGEVGQFLKDSGTGGAYGVAGGVLGHGLAQGLSGLPGAASSSLGGFGAGALMGGLTSDKDTLGGKLMDALWEGGLGGAGGLAGYGMARAGGAAGRAAVNGAVEPTPEARYLQSQGVKDLTLGQLDPKSIIGQIEDVGTSHGVTGEWLKSQRATAGKQFEDAVLGRAVPPGGAPVTAGDRNARLADAYGQINEGYDSVRAAPPSARAAARPPSPARIAQAFGVVLDDPNIAVTPQETASVERLLNGQAGLLERSGATPANLMKVRSTLRENIQNMDPGDNRIPMLQQAEGVITNRLKYALPADALQTLREQDAHYGTYKTVADAVRSSRDQELLTPAKLSDAVYRNTEAGAYARGGGGDLRELAQAGKASLESRHAETGARLLGLIPGVGRVTTGAVAAANASPALKAFALGESPMQIRTRAIIDALRGQAPRMGSVAGSLSEMLAPQSSPAPLGMPGYAQGNVADEYKRALADALGRR